MEETKPQGIRRNVNFTSRERGGHDPTVPLANQAAQVLILEDFKSSHEGGVVCAKL